MLAVSLVGTPPGVLDVHHSSLGVQAAGLCVLVGSIYAERRHSGAVLLGTRLAGGVHHSRLDVRGTEFGLLSPAIVGAE